MRRFEEMDPATDAHGAVLGQPGSYFHCIALTDTCSVKIWQTVLPSRRVLVEARELFSQGKEKRRAHRSLLTNVFTQ